MNNSLEQKINALLSVKTNRRSFIQSPHKYIFMLCLIKMYEFDNHRQNKFFLNNEMESLFEKVWGEVLGKSPPKNSIEYPFYHLQQDGFWNLEIKKGYEQLYNDYKLSSNLRLTKNRLRETIEFGYLLDELHNSMRCEYERNEIKEALNKKCEAIMKTEEEFGDILQRIDINTDSLIAPNPFVSYLNSLHSRDAGNENALAESQACNPNFSRIHVRHSLVDSVADCLLGPSGQSVILTGHAGDGKSTLALAVFKKLKGLDENTPLVEPLKRREDIFHSGGHRISIIKDLSEWRSDERDQLITDIETNSVRMLLITNTGALLETFCGYAERKGWGGLAEWQPRMLAAMDAESNILDYGPIRLHFFNLALHDNLDLARLIFDRMLAPQNWEACVNQQCREHCPVYRNISLLSVNSCLAVSRIFLAYRRMFEYGTRLTIRQLTAHLAYLLTSGLEYTDILHLGEMSVKPLMSRFLFYNRFFGDDGCQVDLAAIRMRVIKEVRDQGFGARPCPAAERYLWLLTKDDDFKLGVPIIETEFAKLRRYGAHSDLQDTGMTPDHAREQVRRMMYFLYNDGNRECNTAFLKQYLGSLSILEWERWQATGTKLNLDEISNINQRVFHVLQEQFTGVRLPEISEIAQNYLYITLSRRRQEIRQSAQIVLAQIDYLNEFKIGLLSSSHCSNRRDLVLTGKGRLEGIRLPLSLPFLDYVLARHQGEVGDTLQAAYANRLERLKADLIDRCRNDEDNEMMLVRLRTNQTFLRQHFAVSDGKLEVSNA